MLFPALLDSLDHCKSHQSLAKVLHALDSFIENLDAIQNYLQATVEKLLRLIAVDNREVRTAALSGLGSACMSAEEAIKPYFESIITATAPLTKAEDEQTRS